VFERYTEKARRVIFFARYEASQLGSPFIDTEHLLLGLLRDNPHLLHQILPKMDFETARQDITLTLKPGETFPTNIDLPLSDQSKRALVYAAEEASRLVHQHIGTEHLLVGLASEKEMASAVFLARFGATLDVLRDKLKFTGGSAPVFQRPTSSSATIKIHDIERRPEDIRAFVSRCKEYSWHWEKKAWKAHDLVMKKDGKGFSFDLTLAETSPDFLLVQSGWKKDHCSICHWELFESADASHGFGFTNGKDWVCTECHERFIAGNFFGSPYSDIT